MKWVHYKQFDKIPNYHLYKILKLRQDIFIIEQNCIYEDIDNYDQQSTHLLLLENDSIVAYSRLLDAGLKYDEASIGRIMVNPDYRGRGLGKKVVEQSIRALKNSGNHKIRIEAQAYLHKFYLELGFQDDGEIYDLDGIPHLEMILELK